jgi:hypothetical protein
VPLVAIALPHEVGPNIWRRFKLELNPIFVRPLPVLEDGGAIGSGVFRSV